MKVGNWMTPNPITLAGDTLIADAKRMLAENNLHALPVVENGRLRGLITRANCMRAAQFVSRTQGTNEFEYFSKRLKVKDLMVRRPATVNIDDTMESTLSGVWKNKPNEIFMDREVLEKVSSRWNEYGFEGSSPVADMIDRLTKPRTT